MWLGIDKGSDSANRISLFEEVEILNESVATTKQKEGAFWGTKRSVSGKYTLKHHDIYANPHIYGCQPGSPTDSDYNNS